MDEYFAPRFTALQQRITNLELHQRQTDKKMAVMEKMIESLQTENNELRQRFGDNQKVIDFHDSEQLDKENVFVSEYKSSNYKSEVSCSCY